jgi:tight adherence protein C
VGIKLLQAQTGQTIESIPNLRDEQLKKSMVTRLFLPSASKMGARVARFTPLSLHKRISQLLVYAGQPAGWDAERVIAFKVILGVGGLVLGFILSAVAPTSPLIKIAMIAIFGLLGYTIPSAMVSSAASSRQKQIRRSLSDSMDLLTISVEAGLGFDAALAHVARNVPGPLAEEISRILQEMQIGVSRVDAFRNLGERTDIPELDGFVLSMIQADMFGVSIAGVLRAQSRELRQKRRQLAEEMAQKVPVKLLFPMIFMVLPALFIVILGPGAIKIYEQFIG